jgi:hypothetical protein
MTALYSALLHTVVLSVHLCSYSVKEPTPGLHPIVLTIAMAAPKSMCAAFFKYAPAVEDLVVDSKPYWNGKRFRDQELPTLLRQ